MKNNNPIGMLLGRVQTLLNDNRPQDAIEILLASKVTHPHVANAFGVALMRCGELNRAVEVFRKLCVPGDKNMQLDAPTEYTVNFATALLLQRNLSGCEYALFHAKDL